MKKLYDFGVLFSSLDFSMFLGMRAGEFWQRVGCTEKAKLLLGVICCILLSFLWLI